MLSGLSTAHIYNNNITYYNIIMCTYAPITFVRNQILIYKCFEEFFKAFLHGKNDVEIHEKISQGLVVSEQLSKLTTGSLLSNLSTFFYLIDLYSILF
jgi:hypothetical protein